LQKLQDFLLFFHHATLATEGCESTIERVLPTMDFLLEKFEEAKRTYAQDPFISLCCDAGWAKMDKYYSMTDRSPVYIAALVLSPQWKFKYIDDNWPGEWQSDARQAMQDFWTSQYRPTAVAIPTQASQASGSADQDPQNEFLKWLVPKKESSVIQDEYTVYLKAPILTEVTDARSWWLEPTQRKTYPNLSIMALDILSIPAMSAEPERLFSSCKITITDRRNQLGIESIEAIECIKSWMCKGSIPYVDDLRLRSSLISTKR